MLLTDEILALLQRARTGDAVAYEKLFAACRDALSGRLPRLIKGWDAETASDLAIQMWQKYKALILRPPAAGGYTSDKGPFHRWVLRHGTPWAGLRPDEELGRSPEVPWPRTDTNALMDLPDPKAISAGEFLEKCDRFGLLLEIIFLPGVGYPHQQLCFVLSKYIHGTRTPRGIDGCPRLVAEKYQHCQLREMAETVVASCGTLDFPGTPFVGQHSPCFRQLFRRLALTVAEMMTSDGASLAQFRGREDCRVADTRLEDYFSGPESDRASAVSVWCSRVGTKVRDLLGPAWSLGESHFWLEVEALVEKERKG